jgi:hypothetical protein
MIMAKTLAAGLIFHHSNATANQSNKKLPRTAMAI